MEEKSAVTGIQAKAADRYAIDVLGIPSLDLMERASAYVSDALLARFRNSKILIVSGVGNNGADGVCVARRLLDAGVTARLLLCENLEKATWEFRHQLREFERRQGGYETFTPGAPLPEADVLVDALFGIGLSRPLEGAYLELVEKMQSIAAYKIAVDVPSGINADTGESMGAHIAADETYTFGRNKTGLLTGVGASAAGSAHVCDIGIPDEAYR